MTTLIVIQLLKSVYTHKTQLMLNLKKRGENSIQIPDGIDKTLFLNNNGKISIKDKNGEVEQLPTASDDAIKIYKALISQDGENPPIVTVLENTLGGEVVWTRSAEGDYRGTLENAFPLGKTLVYPYGMNYICAGYIDGNENDKEAYRVIPANSGNFINVQTYRDEILRDGMIYFAPIQVLVYP